MISKREAAKMFVKNGGCDRVKYLGCYECPFLEDGCLGMNSDASLVIAKQWLKDNPKPDPLEARIQAAINSPEFIDKITEAVMGKRPTPAYILKPEPEADEPVIEYPYVGGNLDGDRYVFFTGPEKGLSIAGDYHSRDIGKMQDVWDMSKFKPFDGTITYKAGKPVKTEEAK